MAPKTAPLVPAAVAGVVATLRMPRMIAPSACHSSPSDGSMLPLEFGTMLPGNAQLAVAGGGQESRLAALLANQHL